MQDLRLGEFLELGRLWQTQEYFKYMVVTIQAYNQAPEVIVDLPSNFDSRLNYYEEAYNEDMTLKSNRNIKIIGFEFYDEDIGLSDLFDVISIGSIVTVFDLGGAYTMYQDFLKDNYPEYLGNLAYGESPDLETKYEVVGVGSHKTSPDTLCVLMNVRGQVYIVSDTCLNVEY